MKLVVVTPCYIEGKEAQEWKPSLISDAVYTFAKALRQTPTRLGVRETLMSPNFQTKGACGTIRFLPSGDRNSTVQLLMVLPGGQSGTGYDFVPISDLGGHN
jgi:branched-chain amino acid transport system substrate-binding protein